MMHVGPQELLLLLAIVLLLFGASRIPEIFRGFGQGVREFKDAMKDEQGKQDRGPDA